jgi:uncharacterized Zn-binding protein involved in type VI secretion
MAERMRASTLLLAASVALSLLIEARAENAAPQGGGPIVHGSPDVSVGGAGAARQGDATQAGGPVVEGSPNVFINGKPAATIGGRVGCGGAVVSGSTNVFVNGKPLARTGDSATGCAKP